MSVRSSSIALNERTSGNPALFADSLAAEGLCEGPRVGELEFVIFPFFRLHKQTGLGVFLAPQARRFVIAFVCFSYYVYHDR